MANKINQKIRKDWKVSMNTGNELSEQATLHSLFDLLAYETKDEKGKTTVSLYGAEENPEIGAKLGHDIILLKDRQYNSSNGNFEGSGGEDKYKDFADYGFDLHCADYDLRAAINPYKKKPTSEYGPHQLENLEYNIYNKSAAILPKDIYDFHNDIVSFDNPEDSDKNIDAWDDFTNQKITVDQYKNGQKVFGEDNFFTVGYRENTEDTDFFDINLTRVDKVFHSSIIFNNSEALTRMYLGFTKRVLDFVYWCLYKNCGNEDKSHSDFIAPTKDENEDTTTFVKNTLYDLLTDPDYNYILKHIYVWVKAPYCGDYIDPSDFDQSLNKDASVIHKNIYLRRNTGDLNRYDETDGGNEEEDTQAYIPKNAPLKDFISKDIINNIRIKENSDESDIEILQKNANNPEYEVGSIFTKSHYKDTYNSSATLDTYFEPEETKDYAKNISETTDYKLSSPVVIPKNGNIVVDSRIISPSIDELWYMLKKIILGRKNDVITGTNIVNDDLFNDDFSYSYAEFKDKQYASNFDDRNSEAHSSLPVSVTNDKDTTLKEINNFVFEYGDGKNPTYKVGDPVDFKIVENSSAATDGNEETTKLSTRVTEFFSNPNTVSYTDYTDLISDFNRIYNWKDFDHSGENTPKFSKIKINGIKSDVIENTNSHNIDNNDDSISKNRWLPREAPLSLRELESRTLGNKYAIVKAVRTIITNFAISGSLGAFEKDSNEKEIFGGSLYQLHKNYNLNPDHPNTIFRRGGVGNEYYKDNRPENYNNSETGFDAVFSDNDNAVVNESEMFVNYSEALPNETNKNMIKFSKMPKLVANYGKSNYIEEESGDYSGADVYLSALGDWRYIGEHVRVPILRSRY